MFFGASSNWLRGGLLQIRCIGCQPQVFQSALAGGRRWLGALMGGSEWAPDARSRIRTNSEQVGECAAGFAEPSLG